MLMAVAEGARPASTALRVGWREEDGGVTLRIAWTGGGMDERHTTLKLPVEVRR
jgi:hypothetical protein